jgi:hypothetical protein
MANIPAILKLKMPEVSEINEIKILRGKYAQPAVQ